MNQKFPDRSLLYLLIVFIGFSVLFGIDFMGDPRPTEETLVAYNEPTYLPTNSTRYDTLVIKEKKEEEKGKEVIDTLNIAFEETPLPMTPIQEKRTAKPKQQKILMNPADSIFFDYLLDNYKNSIINKLRPNQLRSDVLVQYYNRKDGAKQPMTLTQLGFEIHNKYTNNSKEVANVLRFGEDVSLEDIQMVAYVLLSQGIPLRQIVPSSYHSDWKPYAIEIGVDALIEKFPILTFKKIRNFERPGSAL